MAKKNWEAKHQERGKKPCPRWRRRLIAQMLAIPQWQISQSPAGISLRRRWWWRWRRSSLSDEQSHYCLPLSKYLSNCGFGVWMCGLVGLTLSVINGDHRFFSDPAFTIEGPRALLLIGERDFSYKVTYPRILFWGPVVVCFFNHNFAIKWDLYVIISHYFSSVS